jgi:hypothetical protein
VAYNCFDIDSGGAYIISSVKWGVIILNGGRLEKLKQHKTEMHSTIKQKLKYRLKKAINNE